MSPRDRARARERSGQGVARAAPVFAALGDETRLALVSRLVSGGPSSISRLTQGAAVTRQAISKHLRILEGTGLVRGVRRGREQIWELESKRLGEAREWLDAISARWDEALERLRAFVET
jgi:DNA-binding transcriptional ArsR family regulator